MKTHILGVKQRKVQASLIEHMLVILFVVIIITGFIIFLTGMQFSQVKVEGAKAKSDRALLLSKMFLNSQYFVKEAGIFDDGKLAAAIIEIDCKEWERIFGTNWFFEVKVLDRSDVVKPCRSLDSDCNYWMINSCAQMGKKNISYIIPVNVYRVMERKNDIGILKTGVFIKQR